VGRNSKNMAIQAILAFALETDKIEQKNLATVIQTNKKAVL